MDQRRVSRREFLRDSSQAAAGVIVGAAVTAGLAPAQTGEEIDTDHILNYNPNIAYRRLGKTGLMLSEISLGGHFKTPEGGRYWGDFAEDKVPGDVALNRTEVMTACIDGGINYLDITTPAECLAYGVSLRNRRDRMYIGADDYIICPRNPDNRTVERQMVNIGECLRRLGTDHLDIWRPQMDTGGNHTDAEVEVVIETFELAHQQGKVLHLGMSSHNRTWLQHVVETFPQFGMVIFPYTAKSKPADEGEGATAEEVSAGEGGADFTKSIFEAVRTHDVGVVTIKPFAGGSLFRRDLTFGGTPTDEEDLLNGRLTLAAILENPDITATVPGMTTVVEVQNNVAASAQRQALLTPAGRARLAAATDRMWRELPPEYEWLRDWERV